MTKQGKNYDATIYLNSNQLCIRVGHSYTNIKHDIDRFPLCVHQGSGRDAKWDCGFFKTNSTKMVMALATYSNSTYWDASIPMCAGGGGVI